jgi:hypothetical protein
MFHFLCDCSTSVAIDVESKALVEPENEKNATIVEVRSPGFKNEAKLHRGSALKQVSTCSLSNNFNPPPPKLYEVDL